MTGSSFAMGTMVRIDQTFTALLPAELSRKTNNKVEVYSEGLSEGFTRSVDLRFNDVLAVHPDLILWVLTPIDVQLAKVSTLTDQKPLSDIAEPNRYNLNLASDREWMKDAVSSLAGDTLGIMLVIIYTNMRARANTFNFT